MKKIRLNLKRGVKSWSFTLYDSVESAYYMKDEPFMDDEIEEYRRIVTLERGEIIEAEWLGSEWVYGEEDDAKYYKFDKVRMGKISNLKSQFTNVNYLELYSGWVSSVEFPWKVDVSKNDIRITRINEKNVSKIDFSKLFLHQKEESDDKADDSRDDQDSLTSSRFVN